jgi:hypothetical protein
VAVLKALQQQESNALERYGKLSTGSQIWDSFFSRSGPTRESARAKYNREGLAAAITRAAEGEVIVATPGPAQGVMSFMTQREAYIARQIEVGQALAFSPLSSAFYLGSEVAGASQETKESLTLGGAIVWEAVVATGSMAQHRQTNQSLSSYQFGLQPERVCGAPLEPLARTVPREYINVYPMNQGGGGIMADVDSEGVLSLAVARGPNTPSGLVMFLQAMGTVGPNVKAIQGKWIPKMPTNLDIFNEAIRQGKSLEDAARETKTGKWAGLFGFTNVKIDINKLQGSSGNYTNVEVTFTRPEK